MNTRPKPLPKLLVFLALLVSLSLIAAACGDDDPENVTTPPDDTGPTTSSEVATTLPEATIAPPLPRATTGDGCTEARKGGSITMGMFSETSGLDPTTSSGSGVTGMIELMALYDVLMRLDTTTGEYVPHLAESLTSNDDHTEWTLKLRPNISFADGTPLDADAVISSLDRWYKLDPAKGQINQSNAFIEFIDGLEAENDLTVNITLDKPWGTFPYALADEPGMIVNVKAIPQITEGEDTGQPDIAAFSRNPQNAGVGPYDLVRFVPGEEIVMQAKADYWGGPVCIEQLTFKRVAGADNTYDAFKAGDFDAAFLREPRTIKEARDNGDDNALSFLQNTGGVLMMNNGVRGTVTPTSDVRLRQAIFYALDPAILNERANESAGLSTKALLDERSQFYNAALFPEFPTDTEKAKELVAEVKAEGSWDGSIRLQCHNAPSRIQWAIAVEAMLEEVGFEVEVLNDGNIGEMINIVLRLADYDLACWGFNLSDRTPFIPLLQHECMGTGNRTGYCSDAMDAALAKLRAAATHSETQAALGDVWAEWQKTVPSASVETVEEYVVFNDKFRGIVGTQASGIMFHNAYLTQ